MTEKLHWYCLSYNGPDIESGMSATACTYVGYVVKGITMARVREGRKNAGVRDNAVLISASYLGEMTKSEFLSETTKED